jgi:hypothetical protein
MNKQLYALRETDGGLWIHHHRRRINDNYDVDLQLQTHLRPHMCNSLSDTLYGLDRLREEDPNQKVVIHEVRITSSDEVEVGATVTESYLLSLVPPRTDPLQAMKMAVERHMKHRR